MCSRDCCFCFSIIFVLYHGVHCRGCGATLNQVNFKCEKFLKIEKWKEFIFLNMLESSTYIVTVMMIEMQGTIPTHASLICIVNELIYSYSICI